MAAVKVEEEEGAENGNLSKVTLLIVAGGKGSGGTTEVLRLKGINISFLWQIKARHSCFFIIRRGHCWRLARGRELPVVLPERRVHRGGAKEDLMDILCNAVKCGKLKCFATPAFYVISCKK